MGRRVFTRWPFCCIISVMNKKILAALLVIAVIFGGSWWYMKTGTAEYNTVTKTVMLANDDGTFTKAQIIIPDDYKDVSYPLVTLSHGFRGTMDSAGGNYLAEDLATHGIATIRMDFSHYVSKTGSSQTNQYTTDTMISDVVKCIRYMAANYNVDTDRIGLYGRSWGGRVAMKMGNESSGGFDYKAMALVAPAGNDNALQYYMVGGWNQMKAEAEKNGSVTHQGIVLTSDFFKEIESYDPCDYGYKFGDKPVLVIYNTLDHVVLPETSLECANAYKNVTKIKITSNGGHGYEMGYKHSKVKDMLIGRIRDFFLANL